MPLDLLDVDAPVLEPVRGDGGRLSHDYWWPRERRSRCRGLVMERFRAWKLRRGQWSGPAFDRRVDPRQQGLGRRDGVLTDEIDTRDRLQQPFRLALLDAYRYYPAPATSRIAGPGRCPLRAAVLVASQVLRGQNRDQPRGRVEREVPADDLMHTRDDVPTPQEQLGRLVVRPQPFLQLRGNPAGPILVGRRIADEEVIGTDLIGRRTTDDLVRGSVDQFTASVTGMCVRACHTAAKDSASRCPRASVTVRGLHVAASAERGAVTRRTPSAASTSAMWLCMVISAARRLPAGGSYAAEYLLSG